MRIELPRKKKKRIFSTLRRTKLKRSCNLSIDYDWSMEEIDLVKTLMEAIEFSKTQNLQ